MQIVTVNELTKLLKMDANLIYKMVKNGNFPKPLNISLRKYRWDISDIQSWINKLKSDTV
jgi:predicted DNA-binding transcriptional regulator AlpA